jgi:hypothetical protein
MKFQNSPHHHHVIHSVLSNEGSREVDRIGAHCRYLLHRSFGRESRQRHFHPLPSRGKYLGRI